MNMTRSYFHSNFRQKLKILLYLTVFALAWTFINGSTEQRVIFTGYSDGVTTTHYSYDCTLDIPVAVLSILCLVIPALEFAFFKKRRNLDCAYAMPISRRDMGAVHYLTGLILVVVPYSCAYLVNFLLLLRYPGIFALWPMAVHYFICLILGVCFYSVNVFVFNEANSTWDGIWFIALGTFAVFLAGAAFASILVDMFGWEIIEKLKLSFLQTAMGIPMGAVGIITFEFQKVIEQTDGASLWNILRDCGVILPFWLCLGVAAAIGFFCKFGKGSTEKTEEISDSWFGYRVMIPLYAVCGMILFPSVEMWLIIEGIAFVGYIIYRKGFHLKKSDWLILALQVLLLMFSL